MLCIFRLTNSIMLKKRAEKLARDKAAYPPKVSPSFQFTCHPLQDDCYWKGFWPD